MHLLAIQAGGAWHSHHVRQPTHAPRQTTPETALTRHGLDQYISILLP